MKTTFDISNEDFEALLRHTQAKTKREAVLIAIRAFNRQRQLEELNLSLRGSFREFLTNEELRTRRALA